MNIIGIALLIAVIGIELEFALYSGMVFKMGHIACLLTHVSVYLYIDRVALQSSGKARNEWV